jgi:hypothetical protein
VCNFVGFFLTQQENNIYFTNSMIRNDKSIITVQWDFMRQIYNYPGMRVNLKHARDPLKVDE